MFTRRMAPAKPVSSLYQLSLIKVTSCLKYVSKKLDVEDHNANRESKQQVRSYYECLPQIIQNDVIASLLDSKVKRNKNEHIEEMYKIVPHTLQFIVNERTQILKVEHGFPCNISNRFKNLVKRTIRKTLISCSNLRQLKLTAIGGNLTLKKIGKHCRNLTELEFADRDHVNDFAIHWIIPTVDGVCGNVRCEDKDHGCSKLEALVINNKCSNNFDGLSDQMILNVMKSLSNLKMFSFDGKKLIDLEKISDQITQVEHLHLGDKFRGSVKGHEYLPRVFPKLKAIEVKLKIGDIIHLTECHNLVEIDLKMVDAEYNYERLRDKTINLIETHPNVRNFRKICISGSEVEVLHSVLIAIANHCPNIEHLSLPVMYDEQSNMDLLQPNGDCFKKLKDLKFAFESDENQTIEKFLSYVLDQALNIENIELSFDYLFEGFDCGMFFENLMKKNPLEYLRNLQLHDEVSGVQMSLGTLQMISDLPNIREIIFKDPGWRDGSKAEVIALKSHAGSNNLDILYEIPIARSNNLDISFEIPIVADDMWELF